MPGCETTALALNSPSWVIQYSNGLLFTAAMFQLATLIGEAEEEAEEEEYDEAAPDAALPAAGVEGAAAAIVRLRRGLDRTLTGLLRLLTSYCSPAVQRRRSSAVERLHREVHAAVA